VTGTRLAVCYNLDALCYFLAPFDMGQLRRRRRSSIWCFGVDVIGSKDKTGLSRYANTGPIQNYPPTNLCYVCSNHLDRSDLDTRPIMPCNRVKLLLPYRAVIQRAAIFSTLRSALCRLQSQNTIRIAKTQRLLERTVTAIKSRHSKCSKRSERWPNRRNPARFFGQIVAKSQASALSSYLYAAN